jgi:uncharacterized repeat protein (TIGR01451 family)
VSGNQSKKASSQTLKVNKITGIVVPQEEGRAIMWKEKRIHLFAVTLMLSLGYPANSAATDFATAKSYPVGTAPSAIVVGDFNGDGKLDLAVANFGSSDVSILINNGDGTFKAAVNSPAGTGPAAMVAGDFNGDGKLDLVVINLGNPSSNVNGAVFLLLGKGDGTFQTPTQIQADLFPASIAVADLNGDNKLDLILGDGVTESITILLGKGDGTFQPPSAVVLGSSGAVGALVVGDFNADKNVDIIAAVQSGISPHVFILLAKGDGTFQAPAQIGTSANSPHLLAGDFNGDGKLDVMLRSEVPPPLNCRFFCFSSDRITLFSGNGDGTFHAATTAFSTLRSSAGNLASGDFNVDTKPDLIVPRFGSGLFSLGRGDGTFLSVSPPLWTGLGAFVAAADLNDDKLIDLAVTDGTNNAVVVILNTSPTSGADLAVSVSPNTADFTIGGGNLTYRATLFNEGPQDAANVTLTETLPASFTFVSAQPSQGTPCTGTTTIMCNLGTMMDPSTASVDFTVTPTAPGTFSDSLQIAGTPSDLNLKNNTAFITVTAVLPADIAVSGTASKSIGTIGDKVAYTVTVSNKGPATATNVVMTDSLSDNLPVSSLTTSRGSCTTVPANITCEVGTIAPGASVTIGFVITLQTAESFSNNLSVTSDQPDLNAGDNNASITVTVNPADLALTQSVSATSVPTGTSVTFTLIVTNKGPATANNAMLTDSQLGGGTMSTASTSQGSCAAPSNGQITCTLGSVVASATATVTIPVTFTSAGQWTNSASISANEPDPDATNNSASLNINVGLPPDFTVSPANASLTVQPGAVASDILTVTAQGGFSNAVSLTCLVSGAAPAPPCNLSPASVAPGANPITSTLTIDASRLSGEIIPLPSSSPARGLYAVFLPLGLMGWVLATGFDKKRRGVWLLSTLMLVATLLPAACGGSNGPPPPKSFTVTVTAKSGSLTHTTSIALTVQ